MISKGNTVVSRTVQLFNTISDLRLHLTRHTFNSWQLYSIIFNREEYHSYTEHTEYMILTEITTEQLTFSLCTVVCLPKQFHSRNFMKWGLECQHCFIYSTVLLSIYTSSLLLLGGDELSFKNYLCWFLFFLKNFVFALDVQIWKQDDLISHTISKQYSRRQVAFRKPVPLLWKPCNSSWKPLYYK